MKLIVEFSILVEISEGQKKLWFESMYLKLSNGKSRFSIMSLRKKKDMFVLKNLSEVKLRELLTCAILATGNNLRDKSKYTSSSCEKILTKSISKPSES